MEKYKITSVVPQPEFGSVDVRMKRPDHLRNFARVPMEFYPCLRVGKTVTVHQNRRGNVVAYSFGGPMYCVVRPTTPSAHKRFMLGFHSIGEGSLDRVNFKLALMRAVLSMGHRPRWSAAENFKILERSR